MIDFNGLPDRDKYDTILGIATNMLGGEECRKEETESYSLNNLIFSGETVDVTIKINTQFLERVQAIWSTFFPSAPPFDLKTLCEISVYTYVNDCVDDLETEVAARKGIQEENDE